MIVLVVVSSVQFVLETHQRTQIRMNIIVSVVVGLCLFSEVFCDDSTCDHIDFGDCPCSSTSSDTFSCTAASTPPGDCSAYCDMDLTCNHCRERTAYFYGPPDTNYPLYIFLDSLPVLIWVPLILFFNIDLASGPGHSLVFMYQVLVALFHISAYNQGYEGCNISYNVLILIVSGLPILCNVPLQWFWRSPTLTHYSLGYVKILIAGVLIAVSFFLATCTQCPLQCCRSPWAKLRRGVRNWREKHLPQRPMLTGMCSVAMLMYSSLVEVSFQLLFRCEMLDEICHHSYEEQFCCINEHTASFQSLCWGSEQHLPYFIPAWIMVGVAVLLSLPFFYRPGVPALVSYLTRGRVQLPRLHKLAPLFDVFQGVYKPKMQFFTGLHLLYRITLWSVAAFSSNNLKLSIFLLLPVVILAVHSLFQPFEIRRHNYMETLLLVNVVLITVWYGYSLQSLGYEIGTNSFFLSFGFSFSMTVVLTNLPLLCVIVYYIYKLIRHCCCPRRRGYHEIQAQREVEGDGDHSQGEHWEPPQDEAFHGPTTSSW